MDILQIISDYYWLLLVGLWFGISFMSFTQIVSTKRDVRAAIGWSGVVWLVPFFGALLYLLFGINRIERKAARIRAGHGQSASAEAAKTKTPLSTTLLRRPEIRAHVRAMDGVSDFPFVSGNTVDFLRNGDEAFAEMLAAIAGAKKSVGLQTYIFDHDDAGKQFVAALLKAQAKGVEVRVLVDTVGALYYRPSIIKVLKKAGIPVARFNKSLSPWRMAYLNLRNHRKILTIDGTLAFTGGMNIRQGNYQDADVKKIIQDLHFCLGGPIATQLAEVFVHDWAFASGEILAENKWLPKIKANSKGGTAYARGFADGPDSDVEKTRWAIFSALGMAQKSVKIMTPYFLPDRILVSALNHAALRGVKVEILLPEMNNLKYVQWAAMAQYGQVLEGGCKIFHSPPPFDHGKILIVDDHWCLLGSTNWDPRSFRLNFEFNVEVFDKSLATRLARMMDGRIAESEEITLEKMEAIPPIKRALYGWMWLFSPYL